MSESQNPDDLIGRALATLGSEAMRLLRTQMRRVTPEEKRDYVVTYLEQYQEAYRGLISESESFASSEMRPPVLATSGDLVVWIATDGAVWSDTSSEPAFDWHIAGGPAIKIDFEPTRTPASVTDTIRRLGLSGQNIGIYRIVPRKVFAETYWLGTLPEVLDEDVRVTSHGKRVIFRTTKVECSEILRRLTFGAFAEILTVPLNEQTDPFWSYLRIQKMGFFPADLSTKRFFQLIEVVRHDDIGAWDTRSIWLRAQFDCHRDTVAQIASTIGDDEAEEDGVHNNEGGTIIVPGPATRDRLVRNLSFLFDRMGEFEIAIARLNAAIADQSDQREQRFQQLLQDKPPLLDLYGKVVSRPRFIYPTGTSPLGKAYVEPDFVVTYPDSTFRIVEIESPAKGLATTKGQPRAEMTQSAFQVSEFRSYVENHPHLLQDRFPGIRASACRFTIIIGRRPTEYSPFSSFTELRSAVKGTYGVDDVWTYEDVVERASAAVSAIRGISRRSAIG